METDLDFDRDIDRDRLLRTSDPDRDVLLDFDRDLDLDLDREALRLDPLLERDLAGLPEGERDLELLEEALFERDRLFLDPDRERLAERLLEPLLEPELLRERFADFDRDARDSSESDVIFRLPRDSPSSPLAILRPSSLSDSLVDIVSFETNFDLLFDGSGTFLRAFSFLPLPTFLPRFAFGRSLSEPRLFRSLPSPLAFRLRFFSRGASSLTSSPEAAEASLTY